MRTLFTVGLVLLLSSVWAPANANYRHCYSGAAAESKPAGPADLQRKLLFLDYSLMPVIYRKACGLTDERDADYLKALYSQAGCTQESSIGQRLERVLTAKITDIEGFESFDSIASEHPQFVTGLCERVRAMPWPVYDENLKPISAETERSALEALRSIQEFQADYWK